MIDNEKTIEVLAALKVVEDFNRGRKGPYAIRVERINRCVAGALAAGDSLDGNPIVPREVIVDRNIADGVTSDRNISGAVELTNKYLRKAGSTFFLKKRVVYELIDTSNEIITK